MLREKYKDLLEPYNPERCSDRPILSPTTYAQRDKWMRNQAAYNLRMLKRELAKEKMMLGEMMSAAIELDSPEPWNSPSPIPIMRERVHPPLSPIMEQNPPLPRCPSPPFVMAQDQQPATIPWKGPLTPISPRKSVVPGLLQPPACLIMPWLLQLPVPLIVPTLPRSKYVPRLFQRASTPIIPISPRSKFKQRLLETPASQIIRPHHRSEPRLLQPLTSPKKSPLHRSTGMPTLLRSTFKSRPLETTASPIIPTPPATSVLMPLQQQLILVEPPPVVMHQKPEPAPGKRVEGVAEIESTSDWGDQFAGMISKRTVPKRPFAPQRSTL